MFQTLNPFYVKTTEDLREENLKDNERNLLKYEEMESYGRNMSKHFRESISRLKNQRVE